MFNIFSIVISNVLLFQTEEGWEEFFDYIFPEDEATKPNLKLLEMAKAWKKQKEKAEEESEEEKGTSES
jgi:crooked neck